MPKTFSTIPANRPITPLLDQIDSPDDVKTLSSQQLLTLADELREYLLYSVGVSGGHFGANLGVVELTIALHAVFDTPYDQLLWDVGHQAYAHKVLTDRRDQLPTIRSQGGLSPFPSRDESIYDSFGVGHSSTVISAGLGISLAFRHQGKSQKVVCVVGDGAMSAGMSFEAMNDTVQHNADLIVILNDNDMSISHSTGGIARHLAQLWNVDNCNFNNKVDNLFSAIGFDYIGVIDGHDLPQLINTLNHIKTLNKPILLHIKTIKGKGFTPAESDPIGYHAINKLPYNQQTIDKQPSPLTYSQVFGQFLCDTAKYDNNLVAITPAMAQGSGMSEFAKKFPQQFFDVAIAEQHAITLAGGMATQGIKPIVAIYSTFLQRGYDQLIHDLALQNLDVTFAIDRAGLVGADGASHAGVFDYAFLRCIPNVIIACPSDENECYHLLHTCYQYTGVGAVRYPRGKGLGVAINKPAQRYPIGQAVLEKVYQANTNKHLAILAFGSMVATADKVANNLSVDLDMSISVVNMRWVKPLDVAMINSLINDNNVSHIATLEEHVVMGGAGSAVNETIINYQHVIKIINIGIQDRFIAHATHDEQLAECGLDYHGVFQRLREFVG